jgi:aconitate hydratase
VPPGTGICHQVNLEYLGQTVWTKDEDGETVAYPDTLVGTDSHTTMVNGLAVLGWGVGGIEAEAAMLGQPISMLIPEVIGFKLTGKLNEGITATDLVLRVVEMLRQKGVVGKFVEFFGPGPRQPVPGRRGDHRQHGAGIRRDLRLLPRRHDTIEISQATGRDADRVALVEAYAKAQGMFPPTRPNRSSPTRWNSTSPPLCPRSRRPEAPAGPRNLSEAATEVCRGTHEIKGGGKSRPHRRPPPEAVSWPKARPA